MSIGLLAFKNRKVICLTAYLAKLEIHEWAKIMYKYIASKCQTRFV